MNRAAASAGGQNAPDLGDELLVVAEDQIIVDQKGSRHRRSC